MKTIFSLPFWLNTRPGTISFCSIIFIFIVIISFLILAIVFKSREKKKKDRYYRVWRRISTYGFINSLIGLMLLFFSYELTPLLSSRFWYLLWLLEILLHPFFIFKAYKKIIENQKEREKTKIYRKYLPKKNK